jgi:hypothetical protein
MGRSSTLNPGSRIGSRGNVPECTQNLVVSGESALVMSLPVGRRVKPSIVFAALAICAALSACGRTPRAEEGRRRLAGNYAYFDLRVQANAINPNFRSASLELRTDGSASQTCEFKDGKRYQSSGANWSYDGGGNVSITPLKDCSWVYDDRDEPLEVPKTGASLIVEWAGKPVIVMHPDLNAFYEHR